MTDETLVVLAEYNTITEAEIANSILRSAGIKSYIRNEYMSTVYPLGPFLPQIVVSEEDLEQARQLLRHR